MHYWDKKQAWKTKGWSEKETLELSEFRFIFRTRKACSICQKKKNGIMWVSPLFGIDRHGKKSIL